MKMARMAVGMFEPEAAVAEVDAVGDAGFDHPLQRTVNGSPANPWIGLPDERDEVVGTDMALLVEEEFDDGVPLARAAATGWPARLDEFGGRQHEKSGPTQTASCGRRTAR